MKHIKRALLVVVMICFLFALSACCGPTPAPPGGQEAQNENDKENEMTDTIYLTVGSHKISVKLEANAAVTALLELLKESDITYTANDYGGFEKVGALGYTLPRSDRQMTAQPGDVILYSGNQIVLFYGSNSWSYTKLGKLEGISAAELKEILTESNPVTVTIGLAN